MPEYQSSSRKARQIKNTLFQVVAMTAAGIALIVLATLLISICARGFPRLSPEFITNPMSSNSAKTGIGPALMGSISILAICALSAIPLGVASAILLEEYRPKAKLPKMLHGFVQSNITNLAGVPSIVYGILGFSVFVIMFSSENLNEPWLDIGQEFYLEYPGAGGQSFYVESSEGAELTPATLTMDAVIYGSLREARAGGPPAEVKVVEAGDLEGIRSEADGRLRKINRSMKRALRAATVDGAFQVDETSAGEIAAAMLTPLKDDLKADYEVMKETAATQLLAMNGQDAVQQIQSRRVLYDKLLEKEFDAAGLRGLIIEGTEPLPKDVKKWYYMQIPFGKGMLAGGLTLMLVILPVIIVSSQEAIRAVSQEMRSGVLALGGTKWQAIEKVVLPSAIPGICTGAILALSRAIGEAAPILLIGYVGLQAGPDHLMAAFAALPLEIYNWTSEPDKSFRDAAAAGIIVLLAVLFTFNAVAVFIRQKFQQAN
ncbi:PstA family ABC transporter permease [Algisphaera agarilytica]|uniref:Phosphate transport system permease protein n=1 Tax=Algisphaera agarilytica TaxID=1385975 RepID=A0A7X0H7D5_9BACT|nr:ABC transporter permease subunit [Algisphaera agarilytica]MBB6430655.1 phosphate transport system permease protein [Algisphaera agarilytica]